MTEDKQAVKIVGVVLLALLALLADPGTLAFAEEQDTAVRADTRPRQRTDNASPTSRASPSDVDPTKNVLDLVEAAIRRQDDLRLAVEKLLQSQLNAQAKYSELADTHGRELRESIVLRLDSEAKLRAEYETLLRQAEAKRIDAIRLVDVSAAATLAQRTTEQATALATQVTASAEVLRNQVSRAAEDTRSLVATTAATALQNQQQQFQAITTRLAALEQTGAEGKGKQQFQDPAIASLLQKVELLTQRQADSAGVNTGRGDVIGWIVAGLMLLIGIGTFAVSVMKTKS